jgi:mRNA interferase RelE/StbE
LSFLCFEILFSSPAERFFKKIKEKPLKNKYKTALLKLSKNPYIGQPKRGDLSGVYGFDVKYKGINYEIAYTISEVDGKKIIVLLAGTRENFYEQIKRYIK